MDVLWEVYLDFTLRMYKEEEGELGRADFVEVKKRMEKEDEFVGILQTFRKEVKGYLQKVEERRMLHFSLEEESILEKKKISIYHLPVERRRGNLLELEFGSRVEKTMKTFLLLGACSNEVNFFLNYICGVTVLDPFRFKVALAGDLLTAYILNWRVGFKIDYSLTVVDTGLEFEQNTDARLREYFEKHPLNKIIHCSSSLPVSVFTLLPFVRLKFPNVWSAKWVSTKNLHYLLQNCEGHVDMGDVYVLLKTKRWYTYQFETVVNEILQILEQEEIRFTPLYQEAELRILERVEHLKKLYNALPKGIQGPCPLQLIRNVTGVQPMGKKLHPFRRFDTSRENNLSLTP